VIPAEPSLAAPSAAAGLMAGWWAEPGRDDFASWLDPEWWAHAGAVWSSLGLVPGLPERLAAVIGPSYEALAQEYERLFVGPGAHPCPPYESVWRTDRPRLIQGSVMGPAATSVKLLYAELGLRVREESHELPDHVAIELEGLSYGLGPTGSEVAARALLRDHLAIWLPPFCERAAEAAAHDFYRALATATPEWIAGLAELMGATGDGGG
jgi:TorA maturation chaperone TorD